MPVMWGSARSLQGARAAAFGGRSVVPGHHHQRRPQQALVEQVALLEGARDRARRHALGVDHAHGLVALGVERVARRRRDLGQAVPAGQDLQLAQGQLQPGAQRILGRGVGQAGLDRVEQRQQVAEQALVGELARHLQFARQPLALVVQVGALHQRLRAQLLHFGAQRLQFIRGRRVGGPGRFLLCRVLGHGPCGRCGRMPRPLG
jgi:hypothetical protein